MTDHTENPEVQADDDQNDQAEGATKSFVLQPGETARLPMLPLPKTTATPCRGCSAYC